MLKKILTGFCFTIMLCLAMVANVNTASAELKFLDLKSLEGDYEIVRAGKFEFMTENWISPFTGDIGAIVRIEMVPGDSWLGETEPKLDGRIIKAIPGGQPALLEAPNGDGKTAGIIQIKKTEQYKNDVFPDAYSACLNFNIPGDGSYSGGCLFFVRDNGLLFFNYKQERTDLPAERFDILELRRIN